MTKTTPRKALILAAGLGTRLKPFSDHHPKALFPVDGKTLLQHSIEHLKAYNITNIIVNVHHFADLIVGFLKANDNFGINITFSDETGELLDTGGGLKKCDWFFNDGQPFLVHNVDILSNLHLENLFQYHSHLGGLATLVVKDRETSRYFLFDDQLQLSGWENKKTGELRITRQQSGSVNPFAFSGIQVLNPEIFSLITESGKFSITDLYLRLSSQFPIFAYLDKDSSWHDAGKLP
jgi:NDP-sugar pyrophosphorylase family protein